MAPDATTRQAHLTDVLQIGPEIKSHLCPPVSKSLNRESERLKTFKNWPVSYLDPKILAKNGFFYTQVSDVVKCISCGVQIGYWEEGDDPVADHAKEEKNCPFVKNIPCGNIPISEEDEEEEIYNNENDISQDVCGLGNLVLRPFSKPERTSGGAFAIDSSNLWKDFEELGVSKIYGPVSPNYATYASRIKTYKTWKLHDIQNPEKLSEAGFYYMGIDDNVLCFHCGGGLKNWEKKDDPWVEHAKWFSKCRFVFLHKGIKFIIEVTKPNPALKSEETKENLSKSNKHLEDNKSKSNKKESDSKKVESVTLSSTSTSSAPTASSSTSSAPTASSSTSSDPKASTSSASAASTSTPFPSSEVAKLPSAFEKPELDDTELKMCRICFAKERGIVFLPCGHFVCCPECTPSLTNCAVCREPFKATVRAYLS